MMRSVALVGLVALAAAVHPRAGHEGSRFRASAALSAEVDSEAAAEAPPALQANMFNKAELSKEESKARFKAFLTVERLTAANGGKLPDGDLSFNEDSARFWMDPTKTIASADGKTKFKTTDYQPMAIDTLKSMATATATFLEGVQNMIFYLWGEGHLKTGETTNGVCVFRWFCTRSGIPGDVLQKAWRSVADDLHEASMELGESLPESISALRSIAAGGDPRAALLYSDMELADYARPKGLEALLAPLQWLARLHHCAASAQPVTKKANTDLMHAEASAMEALSDHMCAWEGFGDACKNMKFTAGKSACKVDMTAEASAKYLKELVKAKEAVAAATDAVWNIDQAKGGDLGRWALIVRSFKFNNLGEAYPKAKAWAAELAKSSAAAAAALETKLTPFYTAAGSDRKAFADLRKHMAATRKSIAKKNKEQWEKRCVSATISEVAKGIMPSQCGVSDTVEV